MEDCEAGIAAEARCNTEERDQKLQGCCVDVGDVEVVCDLCYSAPGRGKKSLEDWKQLHVGGILTVTVVSTFMY